MLHLLVLLLLLLQPLRRRSVSCLFCFDISLLSAVTTHVSNNCNNCDGLIIMLEHLMWARLRVTVMKLNGRPAG